MLDVGELIRSIIWGLMQMILNIIDILWEAAKMICGLDFSNNGFDWIWNWFVYIELFLVLFIVFRLLKIVFKAFTDDEYMSKLDPGKMIVKMAVTVVIMSAVPFAMKQTTGLVNELVNNVEYFTDDTKMYDSKKLSTLLVDSSSIDLNSTYMYDKTKTMKDYLTSQMEEFSNMFIMSKDTFKSAVKSWSADKVTETVPSIKNVSGADLSASQINKVYSAYVKKMNEAIESSFYKSYWFSGDINDIDINAGEEEGNILEKIADTVTFGLAGTVDKVYYMYPSWSSLFFGLATVIAVAIVFIPILLMMAERQISLILKVFLAPYAISSLLDPESNTYSVWCKYIIADLVSNWFQLYTMMFLFGFIGGSTLDGILKSTTVVGTVAKVFMILGGLIAVYKSPSGVAAIIGGSEMSAASTLQQMQNMMAFGAGAAAVTAGAGILAAGGALGLASKGLSAAGKIANKAGAGQDVGFKNMASNAFGKGKGNPDAGGADGFGGSHDSSINDLMPNTDQQNYASSLGIDGAGMTRGEMGEAVSQAGGSLGAFEAMGMNDTAPTGSQLDYASSFGINGAGMTTQELSSAVRDAGGSSAVFSMLSGSGDKGVPPTSSQISYANSLGIENANTMSRSQLGSAVVKAGGDAVRFNRAGGMSGVDAVAVNRASMMNTKNVDKRNRQNSGVGNFFNSKAAAFQSTGKATVGYTMRRRGRW